MTLQWYWLPRRMALLFLWLMALSAAGAFAAMAPEAGDGTTVEVFVREGCPHCADAEAFLAQLASERPDVRIVIRDVRKEPAALARLKELARARGGAVLVPAIYVGGQLLLGFSKEAHTSRLVRDALGGRAPSPEAQRPSATCGAEDELSCNAGPDFAGPEQHVFEVTLLGRTLSLDDVGLPAFTLAIGLLDGFNPCSMWVLILMISLLAPVNDRRKMLAIAGTFVLVQGAAYFVFLAAWLNLFLLIGLSRTSQLVIAAIAIVAGLINLKDFWAFGTGISLSIPESAKPGIYARIRDILHARNLTAAIIGAIILGVLVQVVELLCTSGFPALFTRILTMRMLDQWSYYGYLLLYIAAYMLDDVIVLGIGVVTLSRHKLQENEGRWLKLFSGVVMIGLGIYLIVDV